MPLPLRALAFALLVALLAAAAAPTAARQPDSAPDAKAQQEKFAAERAAAVRAKFPPEVLQKADELAKRAEAALKGDNPRAAARLFRDARWQLPYLPSGLPPHVVRVLGESRMRHAARVNALAYSADGQLLASASVDGTVRVWDLGNGRERATYRGHLDQPDDPTRGATNVLSVADVAFHPKENLVASASGNQVHLWNPDTGAGAKTVLNLGKTDKPVKALAFSPDGKQLAVGADDGVLRVIETAGGKQVFASPSRNARIEKVAFSPNGKLVAIGDTNSQVAVYVPGATGNPLALSVSGVDLGEVAGVAFTADSAAVFTCGRDGKARLTVGPTPDGGNAPTTATKLRDYLGHTGPVTALAVTPDGKALVTGGDDKALRVWEVTSAKQLRVFQGHQTKLTAVAARPDGRQVASASEDGGIRVWDLNAADEHRAHTDSKESLWAVAVSPDGKRVAAGGADKRVRVYGIEGARPETVLDAGTAVTALAFLPDGNGLVVAGGDPVAKVWDVTAKKVLRELPGHGLAVLAAAVSEKGDRVFTGAADGFVRAFDPADGKELWKWPAKKAAPALAARKGGKHLAVGLADGTLEILDVSGLSAKELSAQPAHVAGLSCAAFSADGGRLATVGGDGVLKVWTVSEGGGPSLLVKFETQAVGATTGAPPLSAVAFSPEGRFVAAAGADAVVRVWDVQTKGEVRGLRGHSDWVTAVAFSPDGRHLASVAAERDNALRVFELPALESGGGGTGHALAVNAVAVSPNGRFAATAGTDQTIKVWELSTGREVATLVGNADTPYAIAFTANDALVMGGAAQSEGIGRLHLWATAPARPTKAVTTGVVYTVVAAADGKRFAAWVARPAVGGGVSNNVYEVYDAKGELVSSLPDKGRNVRSVTFAPDLAWAVAGDEAGTLRIWDVTKKERVGGDWPLFQQGFADVGVSPDKKLLVAADADGLVKVADVEKREVLASGKPHKSGVLALLVSPAGNTFLTIGNDRELKVWALGTDKELKELRKWALPVGVKGATFTPDGKNVLTANADGTAFVLELP